MLNNAKLLRKISEHAFSILDQLLNEIHEITTK